jgi:hypothetical protein
MTRFEELVNDYTLMGDGGEVIFSSYDQFLEFVEEIRQMERERKTLAELLSATPDDETAKGEQEPACSDHPDAPHGFNRDMSHSLGRYVCDCEGWKPEEEKNA